MIDEATFAALAERVGEDAYAYGADRAQGVPIHGLRPGPWSSA